MGLRVKDEKFLYFWSSLKNPNFRGGESVGGGGVSLKNQYKGGDWTVSRFKGGFGKKEGVVFLRGRRGELTVQCTVSKNAFLK